MFLRRSNLARIKTLLIANVVGLYSDSHIMQWFDLFVSVYTYLKKNTITTITPTPNTAATIPTIVPDEEEEESGLACSTA